MNEKIKNVFREMEDGDIVYIWNEYCQSANRYDDEIMDAYTMEEWITNSDDVMNILNRFYYGSNDEQPNTSANPNCNYFTFNGYGNIISFDYIYNSYSQEFYNICVDEMIDYIVENNDSLYSDFIQEILDEEGEEE